MAFSWLLFCLRLSASLHSFPSQRGYLHALRFLPVFHRCCVITDAKLMAGMGRVRGRCSALSSSSSLTLRQVLCSQSLHLRHSQHPWLPFHGSPWMSGLHLALMFGLGWDRVDALYLKVAELCLLSTQDRSSVASCPEVDVFLQSAVMAKLIFTLTEPGSNLWFLTDSCAGYSLAS